MAHLSTSQALLGLSRSFKRLNVTDPLTQCLVPRLGRGLATQTDLSIEELAREAAETSTTTATTTTTITTGIQSQSLKQQHQTSRPFAQSQVLTTLHSWPSIEPQRFAFYAPEHLNMPLRRDILHRAVIYEADATRRGTASTKWRTEVRGSGRKIRPQKGSGQARLGDKRSPMLRGGGVAFGPKPRDFSTELPKKIYDIAWRTALSYRHRKGELIVLDDPISMSDFSGPRFLNNLFLANKWGRANGRSLLITEFEDEYFSECMAEVGEHGTVKDVEDVDVKDLLETGRIIIEREALNELLFQHSSDMVNPNVDLPGPLVENVQY